MRVLQLLNHTRRLNGHVHAAADLACAQAALGHRVMVASGGGDFDALLAANGVETAIVNHDRHAGQILKSLRILYRLARDWKADIIHAHMMTSAVLAFPVCRLLGIPLVTTVHNEFEKSSILMGLGTRVIAVSAAVGRSMAKRGISQRRLRVVLNGTIGAARFAGKDRTPQTLTAPAVIFVGGQHPRKGLPDLLKAFDDAFRKYPQAHLTVIGGGPYLEAYKAEASNLPCARAVTFMGDLDDPFPFLLGADIFVLPSHADPAPLVLSEAREAGCAIIASDVDGIPELLEAGKAGILVPPHNPARISQVLCDLMGEPEKLAAWRRNSQSNIDHLRVERVARETLAIYDEACRERGHPVQPLS